MATEPDRCGEHGPVFFGQKRGDLRIGFVAPETRDVDAGEDGVQRIHGAMALGLEISTRFGHHVVVRAQGVPRRFQ
ncbi:MAG: hypothetical protein BGO72_03945 [Burkholderiales bacterium 70-64]|nr:MAG: hypothetical protein BGO72_03945 [Burkholderiales bacterium 70-64]